RNGFLRTSYALARGAEALAVLDSAPDFVPDAILLDVVMPGLAGLPLLTRFRERLPRVPVILVSGYGGDQTILGLLDAGASELIQKPFTLEALADAIKRCVSGPKEGPERTATELKIE
ncbi:MAG: response regulator, partial [Planctomycetota bacterium]